MGNRFFFVFFLMTFAQQEEATDDDAERQRRQEADEAVGGRRLDDGAPPDGAQLFVQPAVLVGQPADLLAQVQQQRPAAPSAGPRPVLDQRTGVRVAVGTLDDVDVQSRRLPSKRPTNRSSSWSQAFFFVARSDCRGRIWTSYLPVLSIDWDCMRFLNHSRVPCFNRLLLWIFWRIVVSFFVIVSPKELRHRMSNRRRFSLRVGQIILDVPLLELSILLNRSFIERLENYRWVDGASFVDSAILQAIAAVVADDAGRESVAQTIAIHHQERTPPGTRSILISLVFLFFLKCLFLLLLVLLWLLLVSPTELEEAGLRHSQKTLDGTVSSLRRRI